MRANIDGSKGVLQQALRRIIGVYSNDERVPYWKSYLNQSLETNLLVLDNATADVKLPLDRLSIGTSLEQRLASHDDNALDAGVLASLDQSLRLQPRNADGLSG